MSLSESHHVQERHEKFKSEAFSWFIDAVALDDPDWAQRARLLWGVLSAGHADDMLTALLGDLVIGHEFWAFVVPHFQDAYLAEHPGMDATQYEFAFHASAGHRRYRQWIEAEFQSPNTK